ncbi:hypothetical protein, partial [Nocardiopsis xinjiangensis]|uniref:hypothetical protein n=1 Tax=Nocardiopsis xinjiangensis TaxID=124285 RepID=UPI001378A7DD
MAPNKTTSEEQRYRSGDRGAGAGPIIGGAVFVGIITACALVLSYHGLFQLAEYGGHEGSAFAHVFPVSYALLVLMAFWVSYVLRSAPPRARLWVDVGLIPLLILAAGATMAARNLGLFDPQIEGALLSERTANVIVAVAPLAALLIAILLWITVRAHMRRRRQNAAPRPRPSADRTTVLPGRRPAVEEDAPVPLKARLLDLGQSPREEAPHEDGAETGHLPAAGGTDGRSSGPEPAEPEELAEPEPAEELPTRSEEAPLPSAEPSTPAREEDPAGEQGDGARAEAAVGPAASLPRRHNGGNPIKRAAEEAPVVPGASRPRAPAPEAEAEPEFRPTVVPDRLSDEGFEHQSPVGDPATDEAEAPTGPEHGSAPPTGTAPPSASTRAEPTPPVRATERPAEGVPGTPAEPVTAVATSAGTTEPAGAPVHEEALAAATAPGEEEPSPASADPVTEGDAAWEEAPSGTDLWEPPSETGLWEPPTEETGGLLDDYVPPVWTPPEEEGPEAEHAPEGAGEPEQPAPVLDHDTGPEVRAAFGREGGVPPGRARPGSQRREAQETEDHDGSVASTEPAEPAEHTENTDPADGEETAHRTAEPPRETPPPPAKPRSSPAAQDRDARSLDKRPMVLKPR